MKTTAVFTSATYTYFSRARILARSVRRFHPDWHICFVLPDEPPEGVTVDWSVEPFDSVLSLSDLELPPIPPWVFRHNVIELCTAIKGFALCELQRRGFENVIYLDPDIAVFDSLSGLLSELKTSSILLTPHQITPETSARGVIDNEWTSLKYGIYNLGFVGVRSDVTGQGFATWWRDRCRDYCRDDVPNGLFTDQRWCDLVPALFERVKVLRDPGFNVASWNISNRRVSTTASGQFVVNESPLKFFHFSKVDHIGETMLRRYAKSNLDVIELMYWYRRQLQRNALPNVPDRYWKYNYYDDGTTISPDAKRAFREMSDAEVKYANPFATGPDSFKAFFERKRSGTQLGATL